MFSDQGVLDVDGRYDPILAEIEANIRRRLGGRPSMAGGRALPMEPMRRSDARIDIHMPVRQGGFIPGDIIAMFLDQGVPFALYIEPGEDLAFSAEEEGFLALLADSDDEFARIKHTTRIAYKRNRLWNRGKGPYVYLADADILFDERPFFSSMLQAFERHPSLGMVGLCYQDTRHVACGSMMLRRSDLARIGGIRGTAQSCACAYLGRKIKELGKHIVPLEKFKATELHFHREEACQHYERVRCPLSPDGSLPLERLEALVARLGTSFKLYVHT